MSAEKKTPEVCVIPVAGLSSRNLPATKVLHKGLLPLDGKPIIQYSIDAAVSAGVKEFALVYSDERSKGLYQDYFTPNKKLEDSLEKGGKHDILKDLKAVVPEGVEFKFAQQKEPKGLGHAILQAAEIVGDRDFMVILPDDIFVSNNPEKTVVQQMADAYKERGGNVQAIVEVPEEETKRYGILDAAETDGRCVSGVGVVEKPQENPPSNYALMGLYMLDNSVMKALPDVGKGAGGEIQLTDAIDKVTQDGVPYTGYLYDGKRIDCGTSEDLNKANMEMAFRRSPEMQACAQDMIAAIKKEKKADLTKKRDDFRQGDQGEAPPKQPEAEQDKTKKMRITGFSFLMNSLNLKKNQKS